MVVAKEKINLFMKGQDTDLNQILLEIDAGRKALLGAEQYPVSAIP